MLARKAVWLLDEPTNALDLEGVGLFTGILDKHLQQGGLACIATHLPMQLSSPVHELQLGAVLS
jgi:heme exporter protein A